NVHVTGIGPNLHALPEVGRDEATVLFVGRRERYKGYHALRAAARLVWADRPDTRFVTIGQAAWNAALERGLADPRWIDRGVATEAEKAEALARATGGGRGCRRSRSDPRRPRGAPRASPRCRSRRNRPLAAPSCRHPARSCPRRSRPRDRDAVSPPARARRARSCRRPRIGRPVAGRGTPRAVRRPCPRPG